MVPVLAQVDPLPGADIRPPVADRQAQAAAQQAALDMRRQVVAAFQGVLVVGLVLGHGAVEPGLEVAAHRGVGVFVDGQRGGGVLDEHMHQPDPYLADGRTVGEDLVRHQMKAATAGFERYWCHMVRRPAVWKREPDYLLRLRAGQKAPRSAVDNPCPQSARKPTGRGACCARRVDNSRSDCPPLPRRIGGQGCAVVYPTCCREDWRERLNFTGALIKIDSAPPFVKYGLLKCDPDLQGQNL